MKKQCASLLDDVTLSKVFYIHSIASCWTMSQCKFKSAVEGRRLPQSTGNTLIFLNTVVYPEDMQYVNYILPIVMFSLKLKHKGYDKTAWLSHLRENHYHLTYIYFSQHYWRDWIMYLCDISIKIICTVLFKKWCIYTTSWRKRLLHLNTLYSTVCYYVCNDSYIVVHCAWKMYWDSPLSKAKAEEPGTDFTRARIFLSLTVPQMVLEAILSHIQWMQSTLVRKMLQHEAVHPPPSGAGV
jgi:hypothetical protein